MVDLRCKIPQGQKAAVLAWFAGRGVDVNRDEDGVIFTRDEKVIGDTSSMFRKDVNGDTYFTLRINNDNHAALIPEKPNYILWRSDVNTAEEDIHMIEVDDGEGGTRMQGIPKIA